MADLFCGAGGTSTGAVNAAHELGYRTELTAINHNLVAVATHTENHPTARHLCTGVDSINPRDLYRPGELDLLWASPECTHHSVARGGKPINEQSRATAHCVTRWAEALMPPVILVENVPEFLTWGPLDVKGRPLKRRKGELFHAWLKMLEATGYRVEWRILCAADYGDPTTRRRLFIQAVRGRRKVRWPEPTHGPLRNASQEAQAELFLGRRKPWRAAREIIDWSLRGELLTDRKRPLVEKTMNRILAGFAKQLKEKGLAPFVIPQQQSGRARSVDHPAPTVTTTSRGIGLLVPEPFLIEMRGTQPRQVNGSNRSVHEPLGTITAGGIHSALIEPMILAIDHQGGNGDQVRQIDEPLSTVSTKARHAIAEPFLVRYQGDHAGKSDGMNRTQGTDEPLGTVTTENRYGLAEPFLVQVNHAGERAPMDIDQPLPTVTGNRGEVALIEPALLPQHGGGVLRNVSEPAPTITCDGAVALVEPYLVKFYGTGGTASVEQPLDTVTAKHRFGLVLPVITIDGQSYVVNFRFRMLQPHELAGAQGFPKGYRFTGNKTEQVAQIGNAVPCGLAKAIVMAVLEQ